MQRQLAIQRLQEQEKERQMRLEQQKQTVQMRAQMPAFPLPYAQARAGPTLATLHCAPPGRGPALTAAPPPPQLQAMPAAGGVLYQASGPTSFPATFSPAGSVEGSPMHSVYMSQPAPAAGAYPSMPAAAAGKGCGGSVAPDFRFSSLSRKVGHVESSRLPPPAPHTLLNHQGGKLAWPSGVGVPGWQRLQLELWPMGLTEPTLRRCGWAATQPGSSHSPLRNIHVGVTIWKDGCVGDCARASPSATLGCTSVQGAGRGGEGRAARREAGVSGVYTVLFGDTGTSWPA